MKSAQKPLIAVTALSGALLLAGCAPLTPRFDREFGESVRVMNAQQTIRPEASANMNSVQLDGRAAQDVMGRYHKSYATPTPQPNIFTIGIGSGGAK